MECLKHSKIFKSEEVINMMTEVLSKGDLKARAEMLLMGHVIQVTDEVNQK